MKKESEAISRLTEIQSEVSCHYLIKNNGEIITAVTDVIATNDDAPPENNCNNTI